MYLTDWWVAVYAWLQAEDPMRILIFFLCCIVLGLAIAAAIQMRAQGKKLRGRHRMNKRQRRKWLVNYKADRIRNAFMRDYMQGIISYTELNDIYRQCAYELKLPSLKEQEAWNTVEVITPSKDKVSQRHLDTVKNAIAKRMGNFKLHRLLFRPVVIPGPPPGVKATVPRQRGMARGLKLKRT